MSGLGEYFPIENAVEDVANGTCHNHRQTHDEARLEVSSGKPQDVPHEESDGDDAERGEQQFTTYRHSKCHAVVLDKGNLKPVGDGDMLPQRHVGFHLDLDDLVDDEYQHDDGDADDNLLLVHAFTTFIFALKSSKLMSSPSLSAMSMLLASTCDAIFCLKLASTSRTSGASEI